MQLNDITFVTGNNEKLTRVRYYLGIEIASVALELPEIQSLDLRKICVEKAAHAYQQLQRPVLVEDVSLELTGLSGLPGPFVKWFLQTVGPQGILDMRVGRTTDATAVAKICYVLYDGIESQVFEAAVPGRVPQQAFQNAFGWNGIFIPEGYHITYAEMSLEEQADVNMRALALSKLKRYIEAAK